MITKFCTEISKHPMYWLKKEYVNLLISVAPELCPPQDLWLLLVPEHHSINHQRSPKVNHTVSNLIFGHSESYSIKYAHWNTHSTQIPTWVFSKKSIKVCLKRFQVAMKKTSRKLSAPCLRLTRLKELILIRFVKLRKSKKDKNECLEKMHIWTYSNKMDIKEMWMKSVKKLT